LTAAFPCGTLHDRLLEDDTAIDGVLAVAADPFAPGLWHLGLMIIATRLHGRGFATAWRWAC
jgi:hypothetical protein